MKKLIIIMIMVLSFVSLFAQKYEIVSYDISTKGRTKESAVYNLIGGDEGTIVDDCDELNNLIEEKKQTLLNKRIFKNVVVSYEEQKEDYIVPVTIKVNVESAIAMIVTPGGQFDSNYGFGFGAVFEDMNFLGSTNEIEFAVAAFQKDNSFKQGSFASNLVYGFNILGTRIDTNTKVQINKSDKSLTLGQFQLYLSKRIDKFVEQINGIFEIRYYPYYELYNADNGFCFAHIYQEIELENQFGFNVRSVKNVNSWTTTALATYNFQKKFQTKSSLKLGVGVTAGWYPVITFNNGGKEIKWNGDFRTGWMQNANLTLVDFKYWMINGEVSAYKEIRNFMDLSAHVYYRFSNYSDSSSLNLSSNNLRGMKANNSIFNDQTIPSFAAINLDLMTRVFRFKDYFSLYLSPFIDTGIFISKKNTQFHISVGGEGMIIFDEWPGFPMRVSYGFNIQNPSEYELTCTSSFFY